MRFENRLTRVLAFMLTLCVLALGSHLSRAQESSKSSRQRLRRVNAEPAPTPTATPNPQGETDTTNDEGDVVRVNTDLTNILLTAIDKDRRFITTLRREDLRLTENGIPQEVTIFQRETDLPLSLAILIDASESQKGVLADEQRDALAFLTAVLRPDRDQAAIVSFTGRPLLEQPLTNDLGRLRQAVERVKIVLPPEREKDDGQSSSSKAQMDEDDAVGYTGVWDAIWATVNDALAHTPERTRRAIILLSDGDDTSSQTTRQEAIDLAVKHNVVAYSIGVRDPQFPDGKLEAGALRKVSERTGGRAFFPANEAELRAAFAQIQDELRSQYLLAYSPTNKRRDGSYRQVHIELVNPELRKQKLTLLYRQGYYAKKQQPTP